MPAGYWHNFQLNTIACKLWELKATIHSPVFSSVVHNSRIALSIQDIENEKFWKPIYFHLRVVFPALELTCKWLKSLEKIWSMKGTICIFIFISIHLFKHFSFFSEDPDDDDSDNDKVSWSQAVYMSWYYCSDQLEHEYAIIAWALSLVPEIKVDFLKRLIGDLWNKIETVIFKTSYSPLPK